MLVYDKEQGEVMKLDLAMGRDIDSFAILKDGEIYATFNSLKEFTDRFEDYEQSELTSEENTLLQAFLVSAPLIPHEFVIKETKDGMKVLNITGVYVEEDLFGGVGSKDEFTISYRVRSDLFRGLKTNMVYTVKKSGEQYEY